MDESPVQLSWPEKIRLSRRRWEHRIRNLLLKFVGAVWRRTRASENSRHSFNPENVRSSVKRILIIRTGRAIGDAVMSLVLIPTCRRLFPKAGVHLLLRDNVSLPFIKGAGADAVLELHPRFLKWPIATWRLLLVLRRNRYDLVVACDNPYKSSFTTICLGLFTGAPWRLGFENEESRPFLNIATIPRRGEKMVANLLGLFAPFGETPIPTLPRLLPIARFSKEADSLLGASSKPILIFIPHHWRKSWPLASFLRIATGLTAHAHRVKLAFGPGDTRNEDPAVQEWLNQSQGCGGILPPQKLDLFTAVIARCRLFISNDCGPYHIAVATGIPCVAAFLSTDALNDFGYERDGHLIAIHHPELKEVELKTLEAALHLLGK